MINPVLLIALLLHLLLLCHVTAINEISADERTMGDRFMKAYRDKYPRILEEAQKIQNTVYQVVEKIDFAIKPLSTFRIKTPESLSVKLASRLLMYNWETFQDVIDGMHDMIGFRFTCFFPSVEIDRIIAELDTSKDITILETRRTGEGNYNGTNIKAIVKGQAVEIQLRGAYHHAFYEIFHDFGYKAKVNLDKEGRAALKELERLTYEAEETLIKLLDSRTEEGNLVRSIIEFPRVPRDGYDGSIADDDQNEWHSLHSILTSKDEGIASNESPLGSTLEPDVDL